MCGRIGFAVCHGRIKWENPEECQDEEKQPAHKHELEKDASFPPFRPLVAAVRTAIDQVVGAGESEEKSDRKNYEDGSEKPYGPIVASPSKLENPGATFRAWLGVRELYLHFAVSGVVVH